MELYRSLFKIREVSMLAEGFPINCLFVFLLGILCIIKCTISTVHDFKNTE